MQASASCRIFLLYSAVKRRLLALDVTSVGERGGTGMWFDDASRAACLLALYTKLRTGSCLTHVGREGTSKSVALLLADLGVTKTHSRPHVSNDNPFSESAFKTLKYRPGFPDRFMHIEHARGHCGPLLDWYNVDHRHGSLGQCTPHDVHYGLAAQTLVRRSAVLDAAFQAHPERFAHGRPTPATLPEAVWINRPATDTPSTVDVDKLAHEASANVASAPTPESDAGAALDRACLGSERTRRVSPPNEDIDPRRVSRDCLVTTEAQ